MLYSLAGRMSQHPSFGRSLRKQVYRRAVATTSPSSSASAGCGPPLVLGVREPLQATVVLAGHAVLCLDP